MRESRGSSCDHYRWQLASSRSHSQSWLSPQSVVHEVVRKTMNVGTNPRYRATSLNPTLMVRQQLSTLTFEPRNRQPPKTVPISRQRRLIIHFKTPSFAARLHRMVRRILAVANSLGSRECRTPDRAPALDPDHTRKPLNLPRSEPRVRCPTRRL